MFSQSYNKMEIGNMLFGNSRGKFCISREKYEDAFQKFLSICGFDSYGNIENEEIERLYCTTDYEEEPNKNETKYIEHAHIFDNGIFELRAYYWGDSEKLSSKPNFVYKPDNIEISWYKYPLRDSYANIQLSFDYFCSILKKCAMSLNKVLDI